MQSQRKGTSTDPAQDVRSQLGSLVLSNGSTVNASMQRVTPPSLSNSHRPSSPPVGRASPTPPSTVTPGNLNFEQLKQLFAQKPEPHATSGNNGAATASGDRPTTSPTTKDPILSLMQQLQSQKHHDASSSGAAAAAGHSSSTAAADGHSNSTTPKLRPAAVPSSMVPPPKSEQARMAREAAKAQEVLQKHHQRPGKDTPKAEASKAAAEPSQRRAVLPGTANAGATSATTAAQKGSSNNNQSATHSTNAASSSSTAASKPAATAAANAAATATATGGAAASSSSADIANAKAACAFVAKAFGDKSLIDNLDAPKPIVRTAFALKDGGRYIIVGDVHGCVDQLEALIEKVKYVKGKDSLIIIGDYVNKGPDSVGVIRACMRHEAIGVLGNHDFTLLNCIARMRRRAFTSDELRDPVKRLAQEFPRDCECYLRALPHAIRIPAYNVLLVHAGLNIQSPLEQQDVRDIMHVRRLEEIETHTAAHHKQKVVKYNSIYKGEAGQPWAELWNGPEHVIFGHDAYAGFQSHAFACGIDTGCVYGDALTCVVFGAESPKGAYFDVPGLPKHSNERLGLPPPDSDIYEQGDFERQLIRPTTRATPVTLGSTPGTIARPTFLAMPLSTPGDVNKATSAMTATTIVNASFGSPASLMRFATPATVAERNAATRDSVSFGAREVQCASLLSLATAGELTAISVLLCIPSYDSAMEQMLEESVKDTTSQQAFWKPFVTQVLIAVEERPQSAGALSTCETDTLDYIFGVCDELPMVCEAVKAQLRGVQKRGEVLSRGSQKFVATLLGGSD